MPVYLDTRGNSVLSVAICDRCNRKFPYVDLMPDPNFPGMRVCKDDLDNFDPWRLPALQTENIALRFPRPDQNLAIGPVGGQQLVTNGNPNETSQYDSFFIDGTPYGIAGAPGDLTLVGGVSANPPKIPVIYNVIPTSGPQAGGTLVTITGIEFTDVISVKFGNTEATTFSIVNSTQIVATSPAYSITGLVNISVSTVDQIVVHNGAFTYL